jgi:hypothetical protein
LIKFFQEPYRAFAALGYTPAMKDRSLKAHGLMAAGRSCHGPCGGKSLPLGVRIDLAPHPRGWEVEGLAERQWVSATCPECGYSNSFWALGIPGDAPSELAAAGPSRAGGASNGAGKLLRFIRQAWESAGGTA